MLFGKTLELRACHFPQLSLSVGRRRRGGLHGGGNELDAEGINVALVAVVKANEPLSSP